MSTTTLSIYFMQYVFGNADMYPVLGAVVGLAQLSSLTIFPLISKRLNRRSFYALATGLVLVGYAIFFFADSSLGLISLAALFLFVGQAFIQLLMLMFLADTVEYGQLKLGKRNESITFSVQPLINKIGGAVAMCLTSFCLLLSGVKAGDTAAEVLDASGKLTIKIFMLVLPLVFILLGYWIYRRKYIISEDYYQKIVRELEQKGELNVH